MRALAIGTVIIGLFLVAWPVAGPLWAQATAPDLAILRAQRLIERNPYDATAYYRLGDAYIQKVRESGDVAYFDRAEQALRKALDLRPRYSDAVRHLAYVRYSRHDFDGAARDAARAIELNAGDSPAYGILGDAQLEVGKYDQARESYEKMVRLDANLYSYSRRSGFRSLTGDAGGAIEDLRRAIEQGLGARAPRESIAWVQWQLGSDYFALGRLSDADAQFLEALKTFPNYYRASAGLAQVRAAQQRYQEAIDLYQKALSVVPLPDHAAALGDVFIKLGRAEDAKKQYDLVEYIGRLSTLNKVIYNRELAYFYADHDTKLDQALDLARRELEVRRDIYAYDLLAWALYKNGKPEEARAAMVEALKLGTRDARLFFHAGMIEHRLGNAETARNHLRRALATNRHFHVLHAQEAERVLRELGPGVGDAQ